MQCNIDIIQFECAKLAGFIVVKVNYCFKLSFLKSWKQLTFIAPKKCVLNCNF